MPELPPADPPERGAAEGSSAISGLIKATATIGVLAAAAGGSRILLKNLPPSVRKAAQAKIARWGLKNVRTLKKHPTFGRALDRAFTEHPGHNSQMLQRQLSEVSIRELGLLHGLETISRVQAPDLMMQENIKKQLLMSYDLDIPQLRDGAWRRMTLDDMWNAVGAGKIDLPTTDFTKNVKPNEVARKLGMKVDDLKGLRLDPYLMYNDKTGEVANLRQMNLVQKAVDWVEDRRVLGVPIFRLRPDRRGDHLGMAVFGKNVTGPEDTAHPLVKYLMDEDKGQLFVMDRDIYYRKNPTDPFELQEQLSGKWQVTTDYKAAELGLRGWSSDTSKFDELIYGLSEPKQGLRHKFGFGPEYIPQAQHSLLGRLARVDKEGLQKKTGFKGWAERILADLDPTGLVGGIEQKFPSSFGTPASVATNVGAERVGHAYLKRTGMAGFADWANVQAARPFYLLHQFGLGVRPGRNFLGTMGKISALAAGAYMGVEAVRYADWATGNLASGAAGKLLGYGHLARQEILEATGATETLTDVEEEFPGLTSGSLSNIARVAGLALGGAVVGRSVGGPQFMRKMLANIGRKGIGRTGMGREVVRNMITNIGGGSAAGVVAGTGAGLGIAGVLGGDLRTDPEEVRQQLEGIRGEPYRASAGWMLGRDPFGGGRIRFFKPSGYHAPGKDINAISVYGSEGNKWRYGSWLPTMQNWGGLRRLFNPYYAEDRNVGTRPYPVTGGHFGDYPIFGPVAESTIGSILKPQRELHGGFGLETQGMVGGSLPATGDMNAAVHSMAGGALGYYTGSRAGYSGVSPAQMSAMGYGTPGLEPTGVGAGNSLVNAFANLNRNIQEYSGLRGFQIQFLSQLLTGSGNPGLDKPILETSSTMTSVAGSYYGAEPGGMFGMTELLRRFLVRPSGQPTVNPIPNTLPRWLPGSMSMFEGDRDYYVDYNRGDPYSKIPMGNARLPGPGRDALYDKRGGASYDVMDSFLVLADVAPFTNAYRIMKMEVERLIRKGKLEPEWVERYVVAVEQAETRARDRVFHSNRYRRRETLTISDVKGTNKFETEQMPGVEFVLEGTQLDYSEPMKLIAERQAKGMSAAQAKASVEADKARLREAIADLQGIGTEVDITGVKDGKYMARIPALKGLIEDLGVEEEDGRRDQGLLGQAYTSAGKLVGEVAAAAGLIYGLKRGGIGRRVIQKGSIGGRALGALVPAAMAGVTGGWVENKFTGDFTALEHYKRFQVYGSSFADWTRPYSAFVRPWMNSAASTLVDYTPPHREDQYEIEEYFDKLKYVKYSQLARQAEERGESNAAFEFSRLANQTMNAMDYSNLKATTPGLYEALPASEREYFKQFAAEQDPQTRQEIIDSVPEYMKSIYLSIWNSQGAFQDAQLARSYKKYVAPHLKSSPDERAAEYFSGSRSAPDRSWMGWHPAVNLSDVKYRTIQVAGGNPHDHGLFSSQEKRINAFTPWIDETAQEVAENLGPSLNIGRLRKTWNRMATDGILTSTPNYEGRTRADVRIFQDRTDQFEDYYTQAAGGNVGLY